MNKKRIFVLAVQLIAIAAVLAVGVWLLESKRYNLISVIVALITCLPFFISFEKSRRSGREITVIAVMTALTVVGRIIFAPLPGFKPVTALTVIVGASLGAEAGFMTGSMSALISNIYFGQGPWTPFQMAAWGLIGFFAGLLFRKKREPGIIFLLIYSAFAGVAFSLIMDIWTTFSAEGGFSPARYMFYVAASLPTMGIYALSNVIFSAVLARPLFSKLNRIHIKYGVF